MKLMDIDSEHLGIPVSNAGSGFVHLALQGRMFFNYVINKWFKSLPVEQFTSHVVAVYSTSSDSLIKKFKKKCT